MRNNSYVILVLITLIALVVLTGYGQRQSSVPQAWQYKTVYSRTTGFEVDKTFNNLGAQGWEMVAASGTEGEGITYVFKRAK